MAPAIVVEQHFVTFLSPGTLVAETTTLPIKAWDVDQAVAMAGDVVERYDARPWGFYFTTRGRAADELDSRILATSGRYFLGGTIETIDEVAKRADPSDAILLQNMKANGWDRVVHCNSKYRCEQPMLETDTMLEVPACGADESLAAQPER